MTKIVDKFIVFAIMIITYFALITTGISDDIGRFSGDIFVAKILFVVINAIFFELVKNKYSCIGLAVINAFLCVIRPDLFLWSTSMIIYGLVVANGGIAELLFSVKGNKKNISKKDLTGENSGLSNSGFPKKKIDKKGFLERISNVVFVVLLAGFVLLPFILADNISRAICLISNILAFLLAIKTYKGSYLEQKLINSFDEARLEAITEHRLRELEMQNRENEIYMATLSERNRIAREIHDNVGHMLTRGVVQLQAINILNKDEALKPMIASVSDTVNEAMTSIRKSVHELHDDAIDLSVGINEITKTLDSKFEVKVNTLIESPASGKLKTAIIGIIKEAVTNIQKYSKGSKVKVEVIENVTFWKVLVWDNGVNEPFEYSGENKGGIGLEHICTRAKSVGGRANISAGKEGFTVSVVIPK